MLSTVVIVFIHVVGQWMDVARRLLRGRGDQASLVVTYVCLTCISSFFFLGYDWHFFVYWV